MWKQLISKASEGVWPWLPQAASPKSDRDNQLITPPKNQPNWSPTEPRSVILGKGQMPSRRQTFKASPYKKRKKRQMIDKCFS